MGRWTWGAAGTVDGPVRCGPHGLVPASLGLFQTLSPAWGRPLIVLGRWAWHGNGARPWLRSTALSRGPMGVGRWQAAHHPHLCGQSPAGLHPPSPRSC